MRKIIVVSSWILVLAVAGAAGAVEMDPESDEWLDSYEDEDGNLWDVFMSADGFMYDAKVVETELGYEYGTDGGDRTVHLTPNYFWIRKNTTKTWWFESQDDIEYDGGCGFMCRSWIVWVDNNYPQDVDEIFALARTPYSTDYCDDDYAGDWWDQDIEDPDKWDEAQTVYCQFGWPSYWLYFVGEDQEMEDWGYEEENILRWEYRVSGIRWRAQLSFEIKPE